MSLLKTTKMPIIKLENPQKHVAIFEKNDLFRMDSFINKL